MRVCFISTEAFGWGFYGGFGKLTMDLAKGLTDKGIEVFVIVPKSSKGKQKTIEIRNGLIVLGLPSNRFLRVAKSKSFFKMIEADIYHSEGVSIYSWLGIRSSPKSKHIITFQDPRTFGKFWKGLDPQSSTYQKFKSTALWNISEFFKRRAIKKADRLYCQAEFMCPLVKEIYGIEYEPEILRNPIKIPERKIKKASKPTVCFLGRWDPVKRPEMFLRLAKEFPEIRFIAMGRAHDSERDKLLREKYRDIKNLEMVGFVTGGEKTEILEKSWLLVNTSIKEALPVSFLEGLAHQCALLAAVNPDGLVQKFGYFVQNKDFTKGLNFLLEDEKWKKLGQNGFDYVKKHFEYWKVINQHIKVYKDAIKEAVTDT